MNITIYGQEMDNATAALARMNMILHDCPTAEIWQDNMTAKCRVQTEAEVKVLVVDDKWLATLAANVKTEMDPTIKTSIIGGRKTRCIRIMLLRRTWDKTRLLKQGIMQKLLSGKIHLNHDSLLIKGLT